LLNYYLLMNKWSNWNYYLLIEYGVIGELLLLMNKWE
jgi:hypothetical protein